MAREDTDSLPGCDILAPTSTQYGLIQTAAPFTDLTLFSKTCTGRVV